jgi:hypothetical protein
MTESAWDTFNRTRSTPPPAPRIPTGLKRIITPASAVYHLARPTTNFPLCGQEPGGWNYIPLPPESEYPLCGRCARCLSAHDV